MQKIWHAIYIEFKIYSTMQTSNGKDKAKNDVNSCIMKI